MRKQRLDLIDELHVSLFPYVAGEGTRLFDGVPRSYRLDLVSSTASSNGIVELQYRRHRCATPRRGPGRRVAPFRRSGDGRCRRGCAARVREHIDSHGRRAQV